MMSDWMEPSRSRGERRSAHGIRRQEELVDWKSRAAAALLAPIIFNLSLWLVLLPFNAMTFGAVSALVPRQLSIALSLVSFALGAWLGLERLVDWVGHAFFTNPEEERNIYFTLGIWSVVFAVVLGLRWLG